VFDAKTGNQIKSLEHGRGIDGLTVSGKPNLPKTKYPFLLSSSCMSQHCGIACGDPDL
jgi:hypothetical protein